MAEQLRISAHQKSAEERARNAARFRPSKHAEFCFLCGRPLTATAAEKGPWLHLTVSGTALLPGDEVPPEEDQGWFPLGSECGRSLGAYAQSSVTPY